MSPFGLLGTSMAIEGAMTLTTLLPLDTLIDEIPDRLKLYQNIQRERVDTVRQESRTIARGDGSGSGVAAFLQFHDALQHAQWRLSDHLSVPDWV